MKNLKIFALILIGILLIKNNINAADLGQISALEITNKSSKRAIIYSLGPIPSEKPDPDRILEQSYIYSKVAIEPYSKITAASAEGQSILLGIINFDLIMIAVHQSGDDYEKIFCQLTNIMREHINKKPITIVIKENKVVTFEIKNFYKIIRSPENAKTYFFDDQTQQYERPIKQDHKTNYKVLLKNAYLEKYILEICLSNKCIVCKEPNKQKNFKKCKNCNTALYCSQDCQIKDWKYGILGFEPHKTLCAKIKQTGFNSKQSEFTDKKDNVSKPQNQQQEFTDKKDNTQVKNEQPMKEDLEQCANCNKDASDDVTLRKCACKLVHYCSVACQKTDRKQHKPKCKPVQKEEPKKEQIVDLD